MSQNTPVDMRENISALVDGEASDWDVRKTLQQTTDDESYRDDWAAYQKIGAILRKEPHQGVNISASIMEAIEEESSYSKFTYFRKSIGQATVAASVAVIALVGIQQYQVAQNEVVGGTSVVETTTQIEPAPVVQPPTGFEFQPVTRAVSASSEPSLTQGATVQIPVDRDQLKAHLDEIVQEHSQNVVNSNQGVMPMVRVPNSSEAE